jgi:hypothetical protein
MTHKIKPETDKPPGEKPPGKTCDHERLFCSPVALAFVRIVVERRGFSEPQARRVYLDYINRTQPGREHRPCPAA